jgi:hypothetical protein
MAFVSNSWGICGRRFVLLAVEEVRQGLGRALWRVGRRLEFGKTQRLRRLGFTVVIFLRSPLDLSACG